MSFLIDNESVFPGPRPDEYYSDWGYYFFDKYLSMLPALAAGKSDFYRREEGLPEWEDFIFVPSGAEVHIHVINEKGDVISRTFHVCLKDFAQEVIGASEELLNYALSREPELKRGVSTIDFQNKIRMAKDWFYQTYNEKI
jgi:hypothetical protein